MINEFLVEIELNSNYRPGSFAKFAGVGKEINGKRGDVIVELKCKESEMFECNGDDLIQNLVYSSQYQGYSGQLEVQLVDGQKVKLQLTLLEGFRIVIPGFGFMKSDGTRGDCHVIVHLQ